jgi:SAM-dependent methyltransferase
VDPCDSDKPESFKETIDDLPSSIDGQYTVKSTYDKIAHTYDKRRKRDSADQLLDFIFVNVSSGSRVLDVGCGTGKPNTYKLSERYDVCGIDSSECMIKLARENVPNSVELRNIDVREVDFDMNKFQSIVMYYVLVNIPRGSHRYVLEKLYNWLDNGGYLLFSTGRGEYKVKVTENWLGQGHAMFWSFFDNEVYLDMLEDIGYEIKAGVIDAPHKLERDKKRKHPFIFAKKV